MHFRVLTKLDWTGLHISALQCILYRTAVQYVYCIALQCTAYSDLQCRTDGGLQYTICTAL